MIMCSFLCSSRVCVSRDNRCQGPEFSHKDYLIFALGSRRLEPGVNIKGFHGGTSTLLDPYIGHL